MAAMADPPTDQEPSQLLVVGIGIHGLSIHVEPIELQDQLTQVHNVVQDRLVQPPTTYAIIRSPEKSCEVNDVFREKQWNTTHFFHVKNSILVQY